MSTTGASLHRLARMQRTPYTLGQDASGFDVTYSSRYVDINTIR